MIAGGAPGGLDPYAITEYTEFGVVYTTTAGHTTVGSPLVAGEKTLVILNVSQSNGANFLENLYTATNPTKVLTVNPYDGVARQYKEPVLGSSNSLGSLLGKTGDLLIAAGYDKVIFVSVAIGGTTVGLWKPSGRLHHRLLVGIKRMRALINSAPAGTTIYPGVMSLLGESDGVEGTTQAAWEAGFNEMAAAVAGCGMTWPWFVGVCTYIAGSVSLPIQSAQVAVRNGTTILAGGNTDSIGDRYDGSHFNDTGRDAAATIWCDAFLARYP